MKKSPAGDQPGRAFSLAYPCGGRIIPAGGAGDRLGCSISRKSVLCLFVFTHSVWVGSGRLPVDGILGYRTAGALGSVTVIG